MKHKKRSAALGVLLASAMVVSSVLPAEATENPLTITGQGSTSGSSGSLTGTVDAGTSLSANSGTSIAVQATVSGGAPIVYNVTLSWGAMQFEYDYGKIWNPNSHRYENGASELDGGGWTTAGTNNENNKIHVKNDSNFPMDIGFAYDDTTGETALNAHPDAANSVVGVFSTTEDELDGKIFTTDFLKAGKDQMVGTIPVNSKRTATMTLEMDQSQLTTGNIYYYKTTNAATAVHEDDMFFALSGKPDRGVASTLSRVGAIKVTITPCTGVNQATK